MASLPKNWNEALDKILGSGKHRFSESDMSGHVLAPNESMTVFTPHDDAGNPLTDRSNPLWTEMNKDRGRLSLEICCPSTLGQCWMLRASGLAVVTTTQIRQPILIRGDVSTVVTGFL